MEVGHLPESKLKLFVQNQFHNFEIDKLSDDDTHLIEIHLSDCDECRQKYHDYKNVYKDISISSVGMLKVNRKGVSSAVAILLIAFFVPFFMTSAELNENHFVQLYEFDFKIKRGLSSNTDSLTNRIKYFINEKKFSEALTLCDEIRLEEKHLFRFAINILKGQEEKDEELIKKSIVNIPEREKEKWEKRVKKILQIQ